MVKAGSKGDDYLGWAVDGEPKQGVVCNRTEINFTKAAGAD